MRERTLGKNGLVVSSLGLGCMGMSDMYGPADRTESLATLHAALDAGITLLDTGDFYGMGHNEMLIGEALATRSAGPVRVSVKFACRLAHGLCHGIPLRRLGGRDAQALLQRLDVLLHPGMAGAAMLRASSVPGAGVAFLVAPALHHGLGRGVLRQSGQWAQGQAGGQGAGQGPDIQCGFHGFLSDEASGDKRGGAGGHR